MRAVDTNLLVRLIARDDAAQAAAVEMLLSHFRKRPALGFSDCLVLEASRKAGHLPLGTFDRRLGKLEGAQGL